MTTGKAYQSLSVPSEDGSLLPGENFEKIAALIDPGPGAGM